jgi:hypothetical protein
VKAFAVNDSRERVFHKRGRFSFVLSGIPLTLSGLRRFAHGTHLGWKMPATALKIARQVEAAPQPKNPPQPKTRAEARPEPQPEQRLFHARMLVTRLEEWCVEAQTAEEARVLLASGKGHRCSPGESVQVELDSLLDE